MRPLLRLPAVALAAAFFVSASLPQTVLAQVVISATKSDGVPAATKVLPGATVTYTNRITNTGAGAASGVTFTDPDVAGTTLVPGSVHMSPLAYNDSYETLANTTLSVAEPGGPAIQVGSGILPSGNDITLNAPGGTDTRSIVSHTDPANGTIVSFDNSDGSFRYVPNAGFVGTDTFTYTVQNNADVTLTDTATITITVLDTNPVVGGNQKIWYVQNNATAGGLGRSQDPFDTLVEAQTASAAGDTIYVFTGSGTTGQTAGFVLKDSQRLLGEGVALTVPVSVNGGGNPTLRTAGVPPSISNAVGPAVAALNLSSIEIRGFNISTTGAGNNAVDIQTTGASSGSAEVANNTITGAGANGIDFNGNSTGTLNVSVHDNTITATTNGIEIQRVAGAVYITAFDDNVVSGDTGGMGIYVYTATFDATPGGSYQQVSGGTTVVGSSGNTVGSSAMELSNVSGDLAFTDLDLYGAGTGLGLDGTGVVNVGAGTGTRLTVSAGVSTFVSTANAAVFALDATIDIQSALVTSSNSTRQGVYLAAIGTGTSASTFSTTSGSSITSASLADFDTSASNANITYNGTITDDLGTLVTVVNNTGGTVAFTGAITDGNDGDGSGITLTGNTGATITFSGGLTLSTGANPAFTATGGGTVNVTGSANTIVTTTATALNVANTTIGASNLTFRSISSNGGTATGIILDTTGSTGGLRVVGTGSAASGGTIANKTGADGSFTSGNGIYLNSTADVRLAWMQLNDFQNSAVRGFTVTGFSLTNSVISGTVGNNTSEIEGAIAFGHVGPSTQNGLFGNSLIDNVNISGSIEHHLEFYNQSGTMNLTITNSNIHDNSVAGGSDGIQMEFRGTAQVFTHIRGNSFSNNKSQAIQITALETSNVHTTISGNTITRGTQGNEGIVLSNGGDADLTALIGGTTVADGNTISGFGGVAIYVGQVAGQGTAASLLQATIQRNTVTSPLSATNHAIIAYVSSLTAQVSQSRFLIDNNTVNYASDAARAILVDAPDASRTPEFHATVTNNVVNSTNAGALTMISIAARNGAVGHSDVRGNDVNMVAGGVQLNVREASAGSNVLARGGSASNDSGVVLAANNPLSTTAVQPTVGDVPVVENNTIAQASAPTLPGLPLLFAPAEEASFSTAEPDSVQSAVAWTESVRNSMSRSLPASAAQVVQDAPASSIPESPSALTQAELDRVVSAARAQWETTGLSAEQKKLLSNLSFQVADLPGWYLGENSNTLIRIDADAGGNGWFIDPTPAESSEFSGAGPAALRSQPSAPVADRIDLLTTVLHEMGHSLGLCDTYSKLQRNSVMYGFLTKGERRLPVQGQAAGAVPHEHATPHHLGAPLSIGVLPPGKSVTIKYAVVVNDPPLSGTLTSQATVSGGNFANVLTDDLVTGGDPLLPGSADPTVTLVDLPDVSVAISNPTSQLEDSGSPLTYTFTRTGSTTAALSANFSLSGTASVSDFSVAVPAGSSYAAGSGTAVFGAGDSTVVITVTPLSDTTVEPDETVIVNVSTAASYDLGIPASATGTLTNDDTAVAIDPLPDSSLFEDQTLSFSYTFRRTGLTTGTTVANFSVAGTSTYNTDYSASGATTFTATTGSVTFAPGETTKVVTLDPSADNLAESNETIILTVTSGAGYNAIAPLAQTATMVDDDSTVTVAAAPVPASTLEDSGTGMVYTFARTAPSSNALTVTVNISGTAAFSGDYTTTGLASNNGAGLATITFAGGATTKTVTITPSADGTQEPDETVILTVAANGTPAVTGGYTVGASAVATGTITDDDLPQVSVATLNAGDNDAAEGGSNNGLFTFTRNQTVGPLTVNFQLDASSTAIAGTDFTLSGATTFDNATGAGSLTFANGVGTAAVTLTALTESPNSAEAAETARLNVVASPGVYVAGASSNATVTIAANSFLVTTTADSGTGSLRQAVLNANVIAGNNTIIFSDGTGGTTNFIDVTPEIITLTSEILISGDIIITGPGSGLLTISGGNTTRVFSVGSVNAVLSGLTISNGTAAGGGGILASDSILTLRRCVVSNNASGSTGGGMLFQTTGAGVLTLDQCSITGNTTSGGTGGAGIESGAPFNRIFNSTFSGNISNSSGGAFRTSGANVVATMTNCTFVGNSAVSTGGGAIRVLAGTGNALTMFNCTVTGNSLVSGTGGGINIASGASITMANSIVAGNTAGATASDLSVSAMEAGSNNNLVGVDTSLTGISNGTNGNIIGTSAAPVDPVLGPLADNGGPTWTRALLNGSPALNAGSDALLPPDTLDADGDTNTTEPLPFDQRGAGFLRAIGTVDIGAFELQKSVSILADAASKNEGASGTTNFTFTVSRTGGTVGAVAMTYTVSGAAVNGADFVGGTLPTGTVSIADGLSTATVTIPVSGDTEVEPGEAFTVTLTSPDNGYVVTGSPATSTITNDDTATVTIATAGDGTEGASNGSFLLTQTALSSVDTVVNVTPTGSAVSGTDFTALGGTAIIPAGSLTATVTVSITDDRLVEGPETVTASLAGIASGNPGVTLGATLAATITITDNDTVTLGFTAGTGTAAESAGTQNVGTTLTITATGTGNIGLASSLTADITATGGTATGAGTDYTLPVSPAVTFAAGTYATGTATQNGVVSLTDDRLVEGSETAVLGLSIATNIGTQASIGGTTAHTLTLTDNDTVTLGFTAGTGTAAEGAGTQNVGTTLTITATGAGNIGLASSLTADLTATGGTATGAGTDYTLPASPAITFAAGTYATGTATQNGVVSLTDDRLVEGSETAVLGLSIATNIGTQASISGTTAHTLTLTDNDTVILGFTSATSSVLESAGTQNVGTTLTINATGIGSIGLASALTANLTSTGGTATGSGTDYTLPASPAVTFAAGSYPTGTTAQNAVVAIEDDPIVETLETAEFGLSIVQNIGSQGTVSGTVAHTLTIADNDAGVITLAPSSLQINEGTGGSVTAFTFTVTVDKQVAGGFSIDYTTADGTATAGSDYTSASGTVFFSGIAGETHTITVAVAHDAMNELDETFTLALGAISGTTLASALSTDGTPATGTILNDDPLTLSIAATDASADENAPGTGVWRITRNGVVGTTTAQLQIDAASTASAADWTQSGASFSSLVPGSLGTAIIPAGASFVDVTLTPAADIHAEAAESVILKITADAAYALGTAQAAVTIEANDFVVINADDSGEGSLRQAVDNANLLAGDDVITFATPQTIVLTSGELAVQPNGTLAILGASTTSISGGNASRMFNVNSGANLTLRGLWIKDGSSATNGGAIYNAGTVNIISSTLSGNTATAGSTGGAIYNTFYVTVVNSTLSGNTSGGAGGAISNNGGNVTATNSTVSGNSAGGNGGGLHSINGNMSVYNSTITANGTSNGGGGGVYSDLGNLDLYNSIIAGNSATTGSQDLFTTGVSDRNNLIGVNVGHPLTTGTRGNLVGTAATPLNPLLGPLANNGGPTLTHALQDGSPTINAGDNLALYSDEFDVDGNSNTIEPLPVDQRGATFARVIGSIVDIGAYEAFAFRPAITAATFDEDTQNTSGLVVSPNTADGGLTTAFKITNIQNGTLYKNDGTTVITAGTFLTLTEGAAGLKFTPALNLNSPTTTFGFDAQATTDGAETGLRTGVATASITITPVNDAPTVVSPGLADQTILVTATRSIPLSPAFTDLDGDTLSYSVQTNSDSSKASAVINGTSVDIQGIAAGITNITILASDGNMGSVSDTFQIYVGTPDPTPGPITPPPGGYVVSRNTGTLNLTVPITNTTAAPVNGFRVTVDVSNYQAQYPGLYLVNTTSAPGVTPAYIDYPYRVDVGDTVNFRLDFYSPNRLYPNPLAPGLTITTLPVSQPAAAVGPGVPATIRQTSAGEIVIEWNSTPGAWYRIQFSNDMVNWYTSTIPVRALANRMLWYDSGAPFTNAPPAGSRFYRVTEGPAPTP